MMVSSLYLQLFTAVIGLVVLSVLWSVSRGRKRCLKGIPSPAGWPLLGQTTKLASAARHKQILRWANDHGSIYAVRSYGKSYVIISDPSLAQKLLDEHEAQLPKPARSSLLVNEMLHFRALNTLPTTPSCNAYWKTVRKCVAHSFSHSELLEDFEMAKAKALILADKWAALGPGVVVNVGDAALRLSLDVLGVAQLGYDFEAVESKGEVLLLTLLKRCTKEWAARRAFPLRRYLGWAVDSIGDAQQSYQVLQGFIQALWATIKERGPPPEGEVSLAAQLMRLRDPKTAKPMAEQHALAELAQFLLSGYATVGHAISWTLLCLAQHSSVQEQLHQELAKHEANTNPGGLTYNTIVKLPYLDAVVREVLRLYPPCPEGSLREAAADLQIGDRLIPQGTLVWIYTYAMHRSSKLWSDAGSFKPERWLQAPGVADAAAAVTAGVPLGSITATCGRYDGMFTLSDVDAGSALCTADIKKQQSTTAAATKGTLQQGRATDTRAKAHTASTTSSGVGDPVDPPLCNEMAFMPFGSGARSCLGQGMAVCEIKAVVAVLASLYKFDTTGDSSEAYDSQVDLTLAPKSGVPLMISPRFAAASQ